MMCVKKNGAAVCVCVCECVSDTEMQSTCRNLYHGNGSIGVLFALHFAGLCSDLCVMGCRGKFKNNNGAATIEIHKAFYII